VVRALGGGDESDIPEANRAADTDSAKPLTEDVSSSAVASFLRFDQQPPASFRVALEKSRLAKRPRSFTQFAPNESPSYKNGNVLRAYQLEGLNWLAFNWHQGRNSILADEMGLGKTVQTVSLFHYLLTYQKLRGPYLIVAPLSTIPHWQREFEAWTDLNVVVFHGSSEAREVIRRFEWDTFAGKKMGKEQPGLYRFHVLITTFEMVLSEVNFLRKVHWVSLVRSGPHPG